MSTQASSLKPQASFQLAIFPAEDEPVTPGELSPEWTISAFYRRCFEPGYCRSLRRPLKEKTINGYRVAVNWWVRAMGDTRLRDVTQGLFDAFAEEILAQDRSPRTADKHCGVMAAIVGYAGPRDAAHRRTATDEGLFGLDRRGNPRSAPVRPVIDIPPRDEPEQVFSLTEIELILAMCHIARLPRVSGVRPAAWWRALLRFLYNSGFRIGETLALRREDLHRQGNLTYVKSRRENAKQGRAKVHVQNSHAIAALKSLPTVGIVFPWPHAFMTLNRELKRIEEAAGIAEDRRFAFHAFRRLNGTELYGMDPAAAQENLGHESMRTTIGSYVADRAIVAAQARLLPILERLPQPGEIELPGESDSQRRLF